MVRIFDCSNSIDRPISRGYGGPIINEFVSLLHKYATDFGCIFVNERDSFGLSAWTYDKAREYCDELIFKVKIHINDIACFVHDNNKIRCTKLKIMETV